MFNLRKFFNLKPALIILFLIIIFSCSKNSSVESNENAESGPVIVNGEVTVHDPDVIKANDKYYVFGSHIASAKSEDLINWAQISTQMQPNNPIIPNPSNKMSQALNWADNPGSPWAPSVIKIGDKYHYYHCACAGDRPLSALGFLTSDKIEGPYQNENLLLQSGDSLNSKNLDGTIYDQTKYPENYNAYHHPNVVDPHVFYDKNSKLWMVYGSYSGGIFILELNSKTGIPLSDQGYGKKIAGGNHSPMEAPYIQYSPNTDYYYLFLSFGGFDSEGGYNIRVARSKNPNGPYRDPQGNKMTNAISEEALSAEGIEPYGGKLVGNFRFNQSNLGYLSPGHNSTYYNENGEMFIFFHSRFPGHDELHHLRVHRLLINSKAWPVIAPHSYQGNSISSDKIKKVAGKYQYVKHTQDISAQVVQSTKIELEANGNISGNSISGDWTLKNKHQGQITLNDQTYYGVFLEQFDQGLEKNVITFSGLSQSGISIWLSKIKS